jgi:hypothetical protein
VQPIDATANDSVFRKYHIPKPHLAPEPLLLREPLLVPESCGKLNVLKGHDFIDPALKY